MVDGHAHHHAGFDLDLLGVDLPFDLVAGLQFLLRIDPGAGEHLHGGGLEEFAVHDRDVGLGIQSAAGGLGLPLVGIAVAIEADGVDNGGDDGLERVHDGDLQGLPGGQFDIDSGLEIKDDSYYANVIRSNEFDMDYMFSKINKPVDKDEWLMTPQTVNAYYNPTTNEICFPAAILQPPFFQFDADDAANYGAIGVVIGHELTHGFDDQGRQYDEKGNLNDWWTEEDAKNFDANKQVLIDAFNNCVALDDPELGKMNGNGELTLGENIADNGGLHVSYLAMQNAMAKKQVNKEQMDGFTPEQRFFLAYAAVWASNIRPAAALQLTQMDVHSLGRNRVNVALPQVTEFIDAFGIKEGDGMWLAPEKRVVLW